MPADSRWFRQARWGVFAHFLAEHYLDQPITPARWNRLVDRFDVERLANQLQGAGAGYLIFTIGQNSGYFCAPNPVYDELIGHPESHCSRRDLMDDLHAALRRRGIALLAYLPAGAPDQDPQAVARLEWRKGGPDRLVNFQRKWEAVCRAWSERWGKKVRGWWIDGCWFADAMYRFDGAPNFKSFAAALKAGNPAALVAFNPGIRLPCIESMSPHENTTCGECLDVLRIGTYERSFDGGWGNYYDFRDGKVNGAQLHIYLSLKSYVKGVRFSEALPRFPQELVVGYTRYLNERGGVISWEAPLAASGAIKPPFLRQLVALGQAMRNKGAARVCVKRQAVRKI